MSSEEDFKKKIGAEKKKPAEARMGRKSKHLSDSEEVSPNEIAEETVEQKRLYAQCMEKFRAFQRELLEIVTGGERRLTDDEMERYAEAKAFTETLRAQPRESMKALETLMNLHGLNDTNINVNTKSDKDMMKDLFAVRILKPNEN